MTISIVDTSVFCEILPVPSRAEEHKKYQAMLLKKIQDREHLLLPWATIVETGNHVGQERDGSQCRKAAEAFVKQVRLALDGESAFGATELVDAANLRQWLDEFPDWAGQKIGLGDLSIKKEWDRQCELHPHRRVYIWSKDGHLQAYDRGK